MVFKLGDSVKILYGHKPEHVGKVGVISCVLKPYKYGETPYTVKVEGENVAYFHNELVHVGK